MIKVELGDGAVPGGVVVELDVVAQGEGQGLHVIGVRGGLPGAGQGGKDGAVRAVGDQAFVHPIAGEELVGAIGVGVETTHCFEEGGLGTGGHLDGGASGRDFDVLHGVVKLLVPGRVPVQTFVDDPVWFCLGWFSKVCRCKNEYK